MFQFIFVIAVISTATKDAKWQMTDDPLLANLLLAAVLAVAFYYYLRGSIEGTFVVVNTYTHTVTYVTDKMMMSLKEIIRCSGLSPEKLADQWKVLHRGISTWLNTRDLEAVHLEVYNPTTDALIGRWDFDVYYGSSGDGGMWVNTDDIKYHIRKAGQWPSTCGYRIILTTKPGRPNVEGWNTTSLRSTDGFVRQSLGTTIDGNGIKTGSAYWRKAT